MQTVLSITVPFFALILLGYLAARRRWVPAESVPAFNGFLLYFAVPAMLFRFAAGTPFREIANAPFFLAWSAAGLATLALVAFAARRVPGTGGVDAVFFGLAAGVANLGFLGMPLLVAMLGERAAAPVLLAIISDLVVVATAGLAVVHAAEGGPERGLEGLREIVTRVLLNPFLLSVFAGGAFSAFGWRLPTPAEETVRLLALAAGPCALFAIGVSLVRPDAPLKSPRLAIPVAGKLLAHPLAVAAAMAVAGIDSATATVAVLAAALPSAGWVFIFAQRHRADAGRVAAAILWTTAIAFATFSALVWALGIAPPAR